MKNSQPVLSATFLLLMGLMIGCMLPEPKKSKPLEESGPGALLGTQLGRYAAKDNSVILDFWALPDFPALTFSISFQDKNMTLRTERILLKAGQIETIFMGSKDSEVVVSDKGFQNIKFESKLNSKTGLSSSRSVKLTYELKEEGALTLKMWITFEVGANGLIQTVDLVAENRVTFGFIKMPWFDTAFDKETPVLLRYPGVEVKEIGAKCRVLDIKGLVVKLASMKSSAVELSKLCL